MISNIIGCKKWKKISVWEIQSRKVNLYVKYQVLKEDNSNKFNQINPVGYTPYSSAKLTFWLMTVIKSFLRKPSSSSSWRSKSSSALARLFLLRMTPA